MSLPSLTRHATTQVLPHLPLVIDHCSTCWLPRTATEVGRLAWLRSAVGAAVALANDAMHQLWSRSFSAAPLIRKLRHGRQLSECGDGGPEDHFEHACATCVAHARLSSLALCGAPSRIIIRRALRRRRFAIQGMHLARALHRPFFIAAGFYRPHLPWRVPCGFAERFDAAGAPVVPRLSASAPAGMPRLAWSDEAAPVLVTARLGPERNIGAMRPMRTAQIRELRRAYAAAAAWTDSQIGRVLDALDQRGAGDAKSLREATVVVATSDHGFHLGEQANALCAHPPCAVDCAHHPRNFPPPLPPACARASRRPIGRSIVTSRSDLGGLCKICKAD